MAENTNPTPETPASEVEKVGIATRIKNKVNRHPRTTGALLGAAGTVGALAVLVQAAKPSRPASNDVVEGEVLYSTTDTPTSEA